MEKVDLAKNYALSQAFRITKMPTLVLYRAGGEVVERHEGVMSAQDLDLWLKARVGTAAAAAAN